eukprot:3933325-Rhodomonas_salina.1
MEQRLPSARGGLEISVPSVGVSWYVRKQYLDMAWRHAVAMLTILYIMGANKCLEVRPHLGAVAEGGGEADGRGQVLKWTMLTGQTGVLDAEPE